MSTYEELVSENRRLATDNRRLHEENRILRIRAEQGMRDELTGVFTSAWLRRWWDGEKRKIKAVAFIDGDGIKAINDTRGHKVGDAAICHIADAISSHVKCTIRKGGDEFVAIITDESLMCIEWIRDAVEKPLADYPDIRIRASIGVRQAHDGVPLSDMIHDADTAMYRSKRAGGGVITEAH